MRDALLRSVLFVPAANPRALEKAAGLHADALIFDLEDSATPDAKEAARERLAAHLRETGSSGGRIIRVNGLASPFAADDLRMAALAGANAVLLPKVETPEAMIEAADALAAAGAPDAVALWAMIETPKGILNAAAIAGAGAGRRLAAFVVGPNDIALESRLQVSAGRPELLPWLATILLAGKAHGLAVLDGVYNAFRDEAGFVAECEQGRRLGFDGKTLIHPAQIEAANRAFGPDAAEVQWAERVAAAFARPENAEKGVIDIDGRMVERLHLKQAERLLAVRDRIEARPA